MALSKMNAGEIAKITTCAFDSATEPCKPIQILKRPPQVDSKFQNNINRRPIIRNFLPYQRYPDDMDDDLLDSECEKFLLSLQLSSSEMDLLEEETVGQSEIRSWDPQRRNRLTSSNFGRVIKLDNATPRRLLVEELLGLVPTTYPMYWIYAMEHERKYEYTAIVAYEKHTNETVTRCGLFVHRRFGYLAASPKGLVGNDGIVEVKCPYSARRLHPLQIPLLLPRFYCTSDADNSRLNLRTQHNYYYQIQGQLEITGRRFCDFVVWTRRGIHVERIWRDRTVWERVFTKLTLFYKLSMLPEIVDSRYDRGLPLREPDFVLEAIEKKKKDDERKRF